MGEAAPALAAAEVVESFPALCELGFVRHGFIRRIPGIDVATDRAAALARLEEVHRRLRSELGLGEMPFATAEQVHGSRVAVLAEPFRADCCVAGADGLVTNQPGVSLGIYVADCCAIYLADPIRRAIGLVHSGKKGTEQAIVLRAIEAMGEHFDTAPADLVVQLSPCIRPPHYEVDFAAKIVEQVESAGVTQIHDSGRCTASDLAHYYSYRAEKGRTGRLLALLALTKEPFR